MMNRSRGEEPDGQLPGSRSNARRDATQLARHHDPIRNPRAYLLRCATHLWIDAQRRRALEREFIAQSPPEENTPARQPSELRDAADALLQLLAPQERAAMILKDVFDMSLEESAEVLETTRLRGPSRMKSPLELSERDHLGR